MSPVAKTYADGAWTAVSLSGSVRVGGEWASFGPGPPEPGPPGESLFVGTPPPANENWSEAGTSTTLGTLIKVTTDGEVVGGRWLFPSSAPVGGMSVDWVLYDLTSTEALRRASFVTPTWGTWNSVPVQPLPVLADTWLIAAVHLSAASQVAYPLTSGYFATARTVGNLHAPASTGDPAGIGNGRFVSGDARPSFSYSATSYFVDLRFRRLEDDPTFTFGDALRGRFDVGQFGA